MTLTIYQCRYMSTFRIKTVLYTFQKEYDDYISSLLDHQPSRHKLLYEQVEQLSNRGTANASALSEEQRKLAALECEAEFVLEENERYVSNKVRTIIYKL